MMRISLEARVQKLKESCEARRSVWETQDKIREESYRIDAQNREKERVDALIASVPFRYRGKSHMQYATKTPEQERVKKLAMRYTSTFKDRLQDGMNLIFAGKPGTGKTYLSLIMYQEIVMAGFSAHYESSLNFLQVLLEMKFKHNSVFDRKMNELKKVDFLIIDEATESINANGRPSAVERQLLLNIVNSRYENKRCTLIISNKPEEGIVERLGLPIFGRLKEGGLMLAFDWESYRTH